MKVITMCFWRRPDYAQNVLDHLRKCAGIQDYLLLIHIDGNGHRLMPDVAHGVDFAERIVVRSRNHIGCNENTRRALARGFAESDYVIHVEEDVILAPDALRYFEWASQFRDDPRLFTIGAWRHDYGWLPENGGHLCDGEDRKASPIQFFNCWGWATWANRWEEIHPRWTTGTDASLSWDVRMSQIRGERHGIQPLTGRAQNIGELHGTHRGACLVSRWAGSEDFKMTRPYELV